MEGNRTEAESPTRIGTPPRKSDRANRRVRSRPRAEGRKALRTAPGSELLRVADQPPQPPQLAWNVVPEPKGWSLFTAHTMEISTKVEISTPRTAKEREEEGKKGKPKRGSKGRKGPDRISQPKCCGRRGEGTAMGPQQKDSKPPTTSRSQGIGGNNTGITIHILIHLCGVITHHIHRES